MPSGPADPAPRTTSVLVDHRELEVERGRAELGRQAARLADREPHVVESVEVDAQVVGDSGADEAGEADVAGLRGERERDHLVRLGHGWVSFSWMWIRRSGRRTGG